MFSSASMQFSHWIPISCNSTVYMYIPVLDWYGMEFFGKVPYTGRTQAGMVKKSIPDQHWYVCTSLHLSSNIYIWICAKCADGFSVSFLGKANDDFWEELGHWVGTNSKSASHVLSEAGITSLRLTDHSASSRDWHHYFVLTLSNLWPMNFPSLNGSL